MYIYYLSPNVLAHDYRSGAKNLAKAHRYAKALEQGEIFKPVKIFVDRYGVWMYNDGRHRVMASLMAEFPLLVKSRILHPQAQKILHSH